MSTDISKFLDSTYLKESTELGISEKENQKIVKEFILDGIKMDCACLMIRPNFVQLAYDLIAKASSSVKIGTVIDFPFGNASTEEKIKEANSVIVNGAYDLDFVCDYNAFKRGSFEKFDNDILLCTKLGLANKKIVKWIIETGALSKAEIRKISIRIHHIVSSEFNKDLQKVFIKTSTGYYGGSGATIKDIKAIKSVCGDLSVKASGGVSDLSQCLEMIEAGASRIGTSKALKIYNEKKLNEL